MIRIFQYFRIFQTYNSNLTYEKTITPGMGSAAF